MSKKIIIVESPAKAKTIEKFLGNTFKVLACGGHVCDLPEKRLGVDIKNNFEPTFIIIKGKKQIIESLKKSVGSAEQVFLATDPDREGEAICWHLSRLFNFDPKDANRIEFNEITEKAVKEAINQPREINQNLVNSQLARRILDRLVGYRLSPLLWRKIRSGLSAGRVQSVALRLIIEREEEINSFKAEEYWTIEVELYPLKLERKKEYIFRAELVGEVASKSKLNIPNETQAQKIIEELKREKVYVESVEIKEKKKNPLPPFITSSLQQESANKLGFNPAKTMRIAQQLYEGVSIGEERIGLITYIRTDSFRISETALNEVRNYIKEKIGENFLPTSPNYYKAKKTSQDAHEAIRPTSVYREPDLIKKHLTADQYKLYKLIWLRFVASQMLPAIYKQTVINCSAGKYLLRSNFSELKFEGFLKIGQVFVAEEEKNLQKIPEVSKGDELIPINFEKIQHFTEPPARFTEASLIKVLEDFGIGRPSTYAPIISTLLERGYVEKTGRSLKPTELGFLINNTLVKNFPRIINVKFTAEMEDSLDEVASGKIGRVKLLTDFYNVFEKEMASAHEKIAKVKMEKPTEEICDKCGKPMVIKSGRFGEFLSCSTFPKCKNTKKIVQKIGAECPECGGELILKKSKRGKVFYGCENYPKCKFATWNKPLLQKCPECEGMLIEKRKGSQLLKECLKCKMVIKEGSEADA